MLVKYLVQQNFKISTQLAVDETHLSGRIFSLSRSKSYTIVPSKDNEDAAATNNVMLSHLDTMGQKTKHWKKAFLSKIQNRTKVCSLLLSYFIDI